MSRFPGFPIFDAASQLDDQLDEQGYASVRDAIVALSVDQDKAFRDLDASLRYLTDYSNVSGTYNRFRSEVQRFLNYLWVVAGRTLDQVDAEVVSSYFKFLKNPPAAWVAPSIHSGFLDEQGRRIINPRWRPFTSQRSKGERYTASSASLKSSRTALASYFRFLRQRKIMAEDPFLEVRRRDTKAKSNALLERQEASVRRYTDWQWSFIREAIEQAADQDPEYERHLFIIVTMKSLFLRVSELAVRNVDGEPRIPAFSDFQKQVAGGGAFWTYYVFGKGDKGRTITCPDAYLPYLKRWRAYLECDSPLPLPNESRPILPSARGGGLGARQIQRICEEGLTLAVQKMKDEGFVDEAAQLEAIASETHYLRHTGASQAIEAGADIRHISEELGHASAAFTEQVYVNADQARRRAAGRNRSI
ncbi:tyrosine-type recombinase/integrase [Marinobacter nauticus]|uniref:Phage integrase family protein n=1 Tax=Marinobacter nauticus (strain ATCC 700491 / DSM 11845 / VT8) TaxID=351348 RepID=A1U7X4_MARN8|nr:tyrosine-type recombinase/integrase [Marinobacter nauticus]ABM21093.1 phage integrase family protein [Marinobacter nauticus VT8]